jgi:hypothetical protein
MSEVVDLRLSLIGSLRKRAGFLLVAVPMAALIPFWPSPGWLWVAVGLGTGALAAGWVRQAIALSAPEHVDTRYHQGRLDDATFTNQTLIGYGMEFSEYREHFDRAAATRGRLTPEERQALHAELVAKMVPLYLSDNDIVRHLLSVAPTGLGKTEFIKSVMLPSVIKRGGGCLLFDAKGDTALISSIYAMAREFHREEDVLYINFSMPDYSHTYNPLLQGNVREIVSTVMKLFDKRGEQFFRDVARAALTSALLAIKGQPSPVAFNFMDLKCIFSDYSEIEKLYLQMPDSNEDKPIVWSFLQTFHGTDKEGNRVIDTRRYAEWLTGLSNKMLDFAHSEYKRILNDYCPDIELKSAILNNKIIVIVIPALSDKEGVELFGKLFMADFARALGQIQGSTLKPSPPYLAFLDEFGSFADPTQAEIFSQARSANVALLPSVQAIGMLSKVDRFFTDIITGNCWHQLYFDLRDVNSRRHAVELAGTTLKRFRTEQETQSYGYSHENIRTGAQRMESRGRTQSSGVREGVEDLLAASDFEMDEGNAILIAKRGVYRMVLPMVHFTRPAPAITDIPLARFEKPNVPGLNLMAKHQSGFHGD